MARSHSYQGDTLKDGVNVDKRFHDGVFSGAIVTTLSPFASRDLVCTRVSFGDMLDIESTLRCSPGATLIASAIALEPPFTELCGLGRSQGSEICVGPRGS